MTVVLDFHESRIRLTVRNGLRDEIGGAIERLAALNIPDAVTGIRGADGEFLPVSKLLPAIEAALFDMNAPMREERAIERAAIVHRGEPTHEKDQAET